MTDILFDEEIIEIEYDSDGDELVEIIEEVYETDSEGSYYEEEEINDLPAVMEEEDEESDGEDFSLNHRSFSRRLDEEASEDPAFHRSFNSGTNNSEGDDKHNDANNSSFSSRDGGNMSNHSNAHDDGDADGGKPAWATMRLKKTSMGRMLEKDGNLAAPITFTPFKNTDFKNGVCNPTLLKKTPKGNRVLNGEYISAPITHIPKNTNFKNKVVDPTKLKHTEKGETLKKGAYLSAPITHIPQKKTQHSNPIARPDILRPTEEGEHVKKGEYLSAPITKIREHTQKQKKMKKKLVTRKVKKKSLDLEGEGALRKAGEMLAKASGAKQQQGENAASDSEIHATMTTLNLETNVEQPVAQPAA